MSETEAKIHFITMGEPVDPGKGGGGNPEDGGNAGPGNGDGGRDGGSDLRLRNGSEAGFNRDWTVMGEGKNWGASTEGFIEDKGPKTQRLPRPEIPKPQPTQPGSREIARFGGLATLVRTRTIDASGAARGPINRPRNPSRPPGRRPAR